MGATASPSTIQNIPGLMTCEWTDLIVISTAEQLTVIYMEQNGKADDTKVASKENKSKQAFVRVDHFTYDINTVQGLSRCVRRTDWPG